MAKALLLNALHDALSDYVVGLSPERLKVGVWSGKIVLDELQVRGSRSVVQTYTATKTKALPGAAAVSMIVEAYSRDMLTCNDLPKPGCF